MVRYIVMGVAAVVVAAVVGLAPAADAAGERRSCRETCELDGFACVQACNSPDAGAEYSGCAQRCQARGLTCRERCVQDKRP